jgi:predicted membrane protein
MAVLMVSLFLYLFYFSALAAYLVDLTQLTHAIIAAILILSLSLFISFTYNATLLKYLVMPYFYSFSNKTDPDISYLSLNTPPLLNLSKGAQKKQKEIKENQQREQRLRKAKEEDQDRQS